MVSAVARSVSKSETEVVFVLMSDVFAEIIDALDAMPAVFVEILLELVETVASFCV